MNFALNPVTGRLDAVKRMTWGSFYDTTIQTATTINTPKAITFNSVDPNSRNIVLVDSQKITFKKHGVYSITYSIQFTNEAVQICDANVWLRKNDTGSANDLVNSNSRFSITNSHGGVDGHVIGTVNYVMKLAKNDYLEIMWSTDDLGVKLESLPASVVPPVHPVSPSIILTAVQIV